MKRVLAIILGGGAGTRLQPLTLTRAKPAVPLGGNYRLIDIPISNCINSGISKIYALTQFNSPSLNRHISLTYNLSSAFNGGFVEVLAAQQTPDSPSWFQGTADAVRQYRELIEAWDVDQLLILSGDQLYRMDYQAFIEAHRASGAALTVAALPVDAATAEGFGLMRTDADGQIREFREKPSGEVLEAMRVDTGALGLGPEEALRRPFLASMGIYVFERDTLFQLLNSHPEATDFGKDIIPAALNTGLRLQSHLFDGYWEDIGTIKPFYDANLAMADEQPAFSFDDEKAPIYTRSRYLPPSQIHDSQIRRSILSEGCRVVAELHGVNREHPEILPARSLGTAAIEKTQQAPQVMSQWRIFLPELDQPGLERLLHGLLQPEPPGAFPEDRGIAGGDGRLQICSSNPQ